jgi:hypothetical protein
MITPASIGDWAMVGGMLGTLSGFATVAYRSILDETETTTEASIRARPVRASGVHAGGQLRVVELAG